MREVASFMRLYPAYKLKDVLDEYALTFFTLLNEGYRSQYQEYLILSNISMLSIASEKSRKAFLRGLEFAAQDPSDILNKDKGDSNPEEIRKVLNG